MYVLLCTNATNHVSLSIHHNHTAASIECQVHTQQHKDHITITYVHTGTALHCTSSLVSRLLQNVNMCTLLHNFNFRVPERASLGTRLANMCTLLHNFNVCIPERASLGTRLLYSHTDMYFKRIKYSSLSHSHL